MAFIFTEKELQQLLANGKASDESEGGIDHKPVVKLFLPMGSFTWLISELDPDRPDIAFALCDLSQGFPELGSVSVTELRELKTSHGLEVEKDIHFTAEHTLGKYAEKARAAGRIVA